MDPANLEPGHERLDQGALDISPELPEQDGEHDGLMEIISQMEARLAALRESEDQRDRLQEEIKHQFDDLDQRERDLKQREAALVDNGGVFSLDHARLEAERLRIREALGEVSREREGLRTREIEVGVLTETLRRDRELLEGRRAQIEAQERELRGREQVLVTQTERIDQEAGQLEARKQELAAREAALAEGEARTRAAAELQERRAQELASKERELHAQQERFSAMQHEVLSLNRRLADANAMAAEQSKLAEQAKAAAQRAIDEQREKFQKMEAEANRVRSELSKVRRAAPVDADPQHPTGDASPARKPAARASSSPARRRSISLAVIWLMAMGVAALACYLGVTQNQPVAAAWLLGLAFAGCVVGGISASARPMDPSALPVVLFGGTFGLWFPKLFEMIANALQTWDLPLDALPPEVLQQLPMAISLLCAGVVVTFGLAFLGASAGLMVQSAFATIAATGLAALPDPSHTALAAGALLWHGLMAASVARWAMGPADPAAMMEAEGAVRVAR